MRLSVGLGELHMPVHRHAAHEEFKHSQLLTHNIHFSHFSHWFYPCKFYPTPVLYPHPPRGVWLSPDLVAFPVKSTAKLNLIFDAKMSTFEVIPLI